MKKLFLFLILNSAFLTLNCYSQQYGWMDISNNLPSSNGTSGLSDLHFISDDEGWICSNTLGEIYHTTDGGQTFSTQTTQYYTCAIYMLNSSEGYAGGANGRVYKTTNGGTIWLVHGSIGGPLRDMDFSPNCDTGFCCGDQGKIYMITPTGVTSMLSGVSSNLKSISFPGSEGFVCGQSAILHFDGSWLLDQTYPSESYNGICMINDTTGWAVGDAGVIIKTTNGLNWNYQTNPDTSDRTLFDVFFLDVSEGWAVGISDWAQVDSEWVCVDSSIILHTTNGGALWTIEASGMTTNLLTAVQFTSSKNGYVLGNNKTLLKYTLLTDVEEQSTQPTEFRLQQNYPNPFNPSTKISWQAPVGSWQTLKVYDVLGREVATLVDEFRIAGSYEVEFNPESSIKNPASGVFFYQLKAGEFVETRKMILLK